MLNVESLRRAWSRLQDACLAPLIAATRKASRLRDFGFAAVLMLPQAGIDLGSSHDNCAVGCDVQIEEDDRRLRTKYVDDNPRGGQLWCAAPILIDLDKYPHFDAYANKLRRHSKGGILRQVRRARDNGFSCRIISGDLYQRERFDIETSKLFRQGLVARAVLHGRRPLGMNAAAAKAEVITPVCAFHWVLDWGVFRRDEATGTDAACSETLVGFVQLQRSGNIVRTLTFLGHGDYLPQHVMKLLLLDVMRWLLDRQDPSVEGIRYFLYGALEHGGEGLLAWKRSFEFAPYRFRWPEPSLARSPAAKRAARPRMPIAISDRMQLAPGVERQGTQWIITANRAAGHVLFGPYIELPAGRYSAEIEVEDYRAPRWGAGPPLRLEVYDGVRIVAWRPIAPSRSRVERAAFEFIVDPAQASRRHEIRLWSSGYASFRLTRLELARTLDWHDGKITGAPTPLPG